MKFELKSVDVGGETLHGLLASQPSALGTVIHVHGIFGNFYENPFVLPLGEVYYEAGWNYLTANFPGHDVLPAHEHLPDFVAALDAWVEQCAPGGDLVLQGHSLGPAKILAYENDKGARNVDRVKGVVMLSPFDNVASFGGADPKNRHDNRLIADDFLKRGEPTVPGENFFHGYFPMEPQTYLHLTEDGGPWDVFPTRNGLDNLGWRHVPRFLAIGEQDPYEIPDVASVIEMAKGQGAESHLVPGASHTFEGGIEYLEGVVRDWVSSL